MIIEYKFGTSFQQQQIYLMGLFVYIIILPFVNYPKPSRDRLVNHAILIRKLAPYGVPAKTTRVIRVLSKNVSKIKIEYTRTSPTKNQGERERVVKVQVQYAR